MGHRASIRDTSGSRLLAISTNIQRADAERSRWRNGAKPHRARTALGWAIRQAISSGWTAMTSIGLHRLVARCGVHLIVDGLRWRNPTIGRQDKAGGPAAVAALLSLCLHVGFWPAHDGPLSKGCGACATISLVFKAPSAVTARGDLPNL